MSIYVPKQGEVDTIATTSHDGLTDTPWETLAYRIPRNATVPELLRAAKLDWGLLHLPLESGIPHNKIPEDLIPEGFELRDDGKLYVPVPKHFCLRRADNLDILSPYMGNRYKPIDNLYAFEVFDEFIRAGQMTMETAGSLHGGKHVWGLASMNKGFVLDNGEEVRGYFLLIQSHQYGHSLQARFTPIRYPGGNTFVHQLEGEGVARGYYAMPHSRVFDAERIEEIKQVLTQAEAQLRDFEGKARYLAGSHIEEKDGVMYLCQLFNTELIQTRKQDKEKMPQTYEELIVAGDANRKVKKVAEHVLTGPGAFLPSSDGTAWGLYQGVVGAMDHVMGHNPDTLLEASWLGKDAGIKVKALDMSLVLAEMSNSDPLE